MNGSAEKVHSHQGQVGGRFLRLFHQAHQASFAVQFGNPKLAGVVHFFEEDKGVQGVLLKGLKEKVDVAADEVVSQIHDKRGVLEKSLGGFNRVGQSFGLILRNIGDVYAQTAAVAHRFLDRFPGFHTNDDPQLRNSGPGQIFDDIEQDGFVRYRCQLFGSSVS